ncbi:MAG: transposase zinc-binding domain-containing protein [Phycisphaerales bacterium]|nr:MAG: transposase zinc-binding domain-containing protein [Phycisphaerales bacterium]
MGGGRYHCPDCHETFWRYHGCRDRSCPKCHGRQIANWLKSRSADILSCRYFHLIATVPSELRPLFLRHQKTLHGLLMKSAADALRDLAAEKRRVGAQVGLGLAHMDRPTPSSSPCAYVGDWRRRDRGRNRLARGAERLSRTGQKTLAHDCQTIR